MADWKGGGLCNLAGVDGVDIIRFVVAFVVPTPCLFLFISAEEVQLLHLNFVVVK